MAARALMMLLAVTSADRVLYWEAFNNALFTWGPHVTALATWSAVLAEAACGAELAARALMMLLVVTSADTVLYFETSSNGLFTWGPQVAALAAGADVLAGSEPRRPKPSRTRFIAKASSTKTTSAQ